MNVTKTVNEAQDKVLEGLAAVQKPVVEVVGQLAGAVDAMVPETRPTLPFSGQFPSAADVIEIGFGFARKMLDNQRAFAERVIAAVAPMFRAEEDETVKPAAARKAA